jgi:hypothetical protein
MRKAKDRNQRGYAQDTKAARDIVITEILTTKRDLAAATAELTAALDKAVLQLTIPLGGMIALSVTAFAILERWPRR